MAKEEILAFAEKHKLTMETEFVPFSKSRNKAEKSPSLNWIVTIRKDGHEIWKGDYSAGCGHTAAYKASAKDLGGRNCIMRNEAIREECETGRAWPGPYQFKKGHKVEPEFASVLASLCLDGGAIEEGTFDDWAASYGYDTDSRKAESIWRYCVETGLKLRAALGDPGWREFQLACQDY